MHFSEQMRQGDCASRLPAERIWLILNANPHRKVGVIRFLKAPPLPNKTEAVY